MADSQKSSRGGRRPGAGRKPGPLKQTVLRLRQLERFRERVYQQFDPLIQAQLELAKGAFVMVVKTEAGYVEAKTEKQIKAALAAGPDTYRIMAKEPDVRALKDCWDRALGPPQLTVGVEHSTPEGGLTIRHVFTTADRA
jgi:hypothetical protein